MHDQPDDSVVLECATDFLSAKPQVLGAIAQLLGLAGVSKRFDHLGPRGADADAFPGGACERFNALDVEEQAVFGEQNP